MEIQLCDIYEKLEQIRVSLRKLGPERRLKEIGKRKIAEAKEIYLLYKEYIKTLTKTQVSIEYTELLVENLCTAIDVSYNKIISYCVSSYSESKSSDKMESFQLKTASILIPAMDGKEDTTEKMIQGIEMYDSCLTKPEDKKLLISFVIKTRLTKTAKLKLKTEYSSVADLIKDIRCFLLTKKSANSLMMQLNKITQNEMSISEYGTKLEELFVELTISQAGTDDATSAILRPINEKLAIKRFSDGLRNRRLGTIIAARDYQELKDAIRAAEDEESSQPSGQVLLNMRGRPRYRGRWQQASRRGTSNEGNNFFNRGNYYGRGRGSHNYSGRGNYSNNRGSNNFVYRGSNNNYRGRNSHGSRGGFNTRGRTQSRVYFSDRHVNNEEGNGESTSQNQFFRA